MQILGSGERSCAKGHRPLRLSLISKRQELRLGLNFSPFTVRTSRSNRAFRGPDGALSTLAVLHESFPDKTDKKAAMMLQNNNERGQPGFQGFMRTSPKLGSAAIFSEHHIPLAKATAISATGRRLRCRGSEQ